MRKGLSVVAWTLLLSGSLRANGPWNEKKSTEWTKDDVRRILYESPWVRRFVITTRDVEDLVPDPGPTGNELRGYHSKESKEDSAVTTEFYVRWVSSRTVGEALVRRQTWLKSSVVPPSATPVRMEFEIAISGRDMSSFNDAKETALRKKCYLVADSDQRTIPPSRVEIARTTGGRIRGILFHFPRRTAAGEPTISTHEKKVWFIEYGSRKEIRVAFSPQLMVDGKGVDL